MSRINNLSKGNLRDMKRQVERQALATPLSNSSIGRGRMRFYDGSVLLIENGALQVTGTATISGTMDVTGTMNVSGTLDVTGPTNLKGQVTVTGHTLFNGDVRTTGKLTVQGDTRLEGLATLTADLNVTGGGKITAGNVRMSPSAANGGLEFLSGGGIGGNDGGVVMRGSSNAGFLAQAVAQVFAGARSFEVRSTGYNFSNMPTTTTGAANVHMDASGNLYRVI